MKENDLSKQFVFGEPGSESVVTVTSVGQFHDADEGEPRQRFECKVSATDWEFTTDELESPPGDEMDLDEAARTWFCFLLSDPSPYPPMVQLWIGQYHSQIGDLALEPTHNGHTLFQ